MQSSDVACVTWPAMTWQRRTAAADTAHREYVLLEEQRHAEVTAVTERRERERERQRAAAAAAGISEDRMSSYKMPWLSSSRQ